MDPPQDPPQEQEQEHEKEPPVTTKPKFKSMRERARKQFESNSVADLDDFFSLSGYLSYL